MLKSERHTLAKKCFRPEFVPRWGDPLRGGGEREGLSTNQICFDFRKQQLNFLATKPNHKATILTQTIAEVKR